MANPRGMIALNGSKDMCVMACLASAEGAVTIVHFDKGHHTFAIQAHLNSISAMALNNDGTLLATASAKGQVIRIFSTENGHQIQELRRGTDEAEIISLAFDPVSQYIGCTSNKGTVHVYSIRSDVSLAAMTDKQLSQAQQSPQKAPDAAASDKLEIKPLSAAPVTHPQEGLTQNPKSMFSFLKVFFPKYFSCEWSFAQFRIQDWQAQCAIRDKYVIAISRDGNYYVGEIDPKLGGDCKMIQHRALVKDE